jgi:hypothetical protein
MQKDGRIDPSAWLHFRKMQGLYCGNGDRTRGAGRNLVARNKSGQLSHSLFSQFQPDCEGEQLGFDFIRFRSSGGRPLEFRSYRLAAEVSRAHRDLLKRA